MKQVLAAQLAEWLDNRDATAPMDALLRHLHTLKGGARMANLTSIGDLSHAVESLLIAVGEIGRAHV